MNNIGPTTHEEAIGINNFVRTKTKKVVIRKDCPYKGDKVFDGIVYSPFVCCIIKDVCIFNDEYLECPIYKDEEEYFGNNA